MIEILSVKKTTTFSGHKDCIYALEKHALSNKFFSAGAEGIVAFWDHLNPEHGELIVNVPNSIYALKYIKDKDQLLIGQNFEGIHLIDLGSKTEIKSLKLVATYIFDIQIFNNIVLVACGNGPIFIVDLESFILVHTLSYSEKSARTIAINPVTKEFAVGYSDNKIRIFSLLDYSLKYEIDAHKLSVFCIRYSPDFSLLLSGSRDAHLKAWQVWNHYEMVESIVAHMYAINHIDFSPDGSLFATCSMDKTIKIWTPDFKLLKVIDKSRYQGHSTSVNKILWTKYPDKLISCSDDKQIMLWEIEKE